tara:strand:- start:61 stop:354 length:294 start_codon:yes stop_codon:yes gene_type:complete
MVSTEVLGFIGAAIIISAYIPQIRRIVKEHCSGGISLHAWIIWLVATILILIHAIAIKDTVFMTLQSINVIAITLTIILILKYRGRSCRSIVHKKKR